MKFLFSDVFFTMASVQRPHAVEVLELVGEISWCDVMDKGSQILPPSSCLRGVEIDWAAVRPYIYLGAH